MPETDKRLPCSEMKTARLFVVGRLVSQLLSASFAGGERYAMRCFADSQSAFEHECEHGFIARVVNMCKENIDLFFTRITRERLWLAEEVSLGDDETWHGNVADNGEKIIECAQ